MIPINFQWHHYILVGCMGIFYFHIFLRWIYIKGVQSGYNRQEPPINALARNGFKGELRMGPLVVKMGEEE